MVYLRMLGENELDGTGQEKTGTICLAGTKRPLFLSQTFWDSDLSVSNWSDSFILFFFFSSPIYEDFSMQVNLSFAAREYFKTKGRTKTWEGYSIAATMGIGGWCLQMETRHVSTPFPENRGFSCCPYNRCTWHRQNMLAGWRELRPGCV